MTYSVYIHNPVNVDGRCNDSAYPLLCWRIDEADDAYLRIVPGADDKGVINVYPITKPRSAGSDGVSHYVRIPQRVTDIEIARLEGEYEFISLVRQLAIDPVEMPTPHERLEQYLANEING